MSVAILTATLLTASAKNDDPTLMTVNGKKVSLSEFEYLYNKNNSQQLQPRTLDEYVDMFVTYKLKVADAEAAGIDTTQAFINEYNGYRDELARPYLRKASVEDSLVNEAYSWMKEDIDVSHIMVRRGNNPASVASQKALLDSLRTEIINGADFGAIADAYSIDQAAKRNHGHMGWMCANRYPYSFEKVAYNLEIGELSPVMETPFGYHIIKLHARRPARGTVLTQHILKLVPQGSSDEVDAKAKAQIDSIYNVLKGGADFSEVAKVESQDGSARNGGKLPWFGTGEMVPEFEEVAFSIADGAISEPFKTRFGYHIVRRIESKGIKPLEEARAEIINAMSRDERGSMAEDIRLAELKVEHGSVVVESTYKMIKDAIEANNGLDSTLIDTYRGSVLPIIKVDGNEVALSDVIRELARTRLPQNLSRSIETLERCVNNLLDKTTLECEKDCLAEKYPEFRNLTNEYRDGMLLFEISNRNVWDRASKDKEGLEKYFRENQSKYTWSAPKYKGFVIHTTGDSIRSAVAKFLEENKPMSDSVSKVLRAEFGKDVKIERLVVAKGENAIVDYVAFGGAEPELSGKWNGYITYLGHTIAAPEEASDVRSQVTSDYQAYLESVWVDNLRSKYSWEVNKKVLKKVK